ncbi:unnamed protein product [Arabidopsis thaliana]|uniref:Uncharacterized protein n=1 Tax=Arabidopsis thaliana TaxID=3702 RepID=A0A654ESG4_ARATH|nr:unnamed protein product [Arabidopsis thaliana]
MDGKKKEKPAAQFHSVAKPEESSTLYRSRGNLCNDICTRPNDIAGPHYMSTCTLQSLERLKELCRIPPEIMAESKTHGPMESHGVPGGPSLRLGLLLGNSWNCPAPTNPQPSLNYLGDHNCYGGSRIRYRAFIAQTLSTEEFIELFKIVFEGKTLWNSFTLDRFIEANHKLRMSPPGQLHQLPPPPSLSQGTSSRALASRCNVLSKPMVEACEVNKAFLATTIDKKEYSRTLLLDNGSAERARSADAFRSTLRHERHGGRSPRRKRSPHRDSPRSSPRGGLSSEPIGNLVRKKRDRPARGSSSPRRDKSKARTFDRWRPEFENASYSMLTIHRRQKLEDQVDHLSSELMESNGELQDQYRRHDKLQDELSVAQDRLSESESAAYTLNNQFTELMAKYKAIAKLRDAELAKLALKARKEVKGRGIELIQGAILFIQNEKARSELESNIKEHEINLLLLDQVHEEDFSEDPLFLSGDDFEPPGVLFPHTAFHFPPKDKKEAYDHMDKVVNKHHRLCLKRQTLEARIARVERKVKAMESDPFQWELRNFDCVAKIPTMLWMYLHARGQVLGLVNAHVEVVPSESEEDNEEEDIDPSNCVKNEPKVDDKNEASTSNAESVMKEHVPKPLP